MDAGDEIIILETYDSPILAHIVRTRLEDNGILSFVDENMTYVYPLYNSAMGGVKLKIFAKDLERCKAILAQDDSIAAGTMPDDEETTCPFCGSEDVKPNVAGDKKLSKFGLSFLFASSVPSTWHCNNCGNDFE